MARKFSEWQFAVNEGPMDRAVRIALGLALLAIMFVGPQSLWGVVGVVPLATGIVGYCPIYAILGFSTVGSPHKVTHA